MTTERPKLPRLQVTVLDPDTGESKSTTVYQTSQTPGDFLAFLKRLIVTDQQKRQAQKATA